MKREQLLSIIDQKDFQTFTAEGNLGSLGASAEVVVQGKSRRFWVTDILPFLLDADGNNVLESKMPMDDISVSINVGGVDFTNGSVPLAALAPQFDNKELHSGWFLPANEKITFRFEARRLPSGKEASVYPLLAKVTIKGYELQ
jgi:hypothetical protein